MGILSVFVYFRLQISKPSYFFRLNPKVHKANNFYWQKLITV